MFSYYNSTLPSSDNDQYDQYESKYCQSHANNNSYSMEMNYGREVALNMIQYKKCMTKCIKKAVKTYPCVYSEYICMEKCNSIRHNV